MSVRGEHKIVCLWEHEVRAAAKSLKTMVAMHEDAATSKDKTGAAMIDALNACMAALHGADEDDVCLVMSAAPDLRKVIRSRKKPAGEKDAQ